MTKAFDPGTWESRYRNELKKNEGSIGILMEGDSWFAYPNFLETNIYMALDAFNGPSAAIWSLAHSGDTAHEIAFGQQFEVLRRLFSDATLPIDAFLFSAGGNDIVGQNLLTFINEYQDGMHWMDCIDVPYLTLKLANIRNAYQRIIDLRNAYKPQTVIYTHSYDFAAPTGKGINLLWFPIAGGWLKKSLEIRHVKDFDMQLAIVTYLLMEFARLVQDLTEVNSNFVHIKTQGTLNQKTDWANELHPTTNGFYKMASLFQNALKDHFPTLPSPATKTLQALAKAKGR